MKFLKSISFFIKTKHFPNTYRRLFREISNCYLTFTNPGHAIVGGKEVICTTNRQALFLSVDKKVFYVDRERLVVERNGDDEILCLSDERLRDLRRVLNIMVEEGVPFGMSDISVNHLRM
jgi:hypothetical protein